MLTRLWRKRRPSPSPARQLDVAAVVPAAWHDAAAMALLPPLRPAGRSLAFATSLSSRRPAQRVLEPLGHEVAAEGPGGLLIGIATPLGLAVAADATIARLTSRADMPMRRIESPPVEAPRYVEAATPRRVSVAPSPPAVAPV